jgi:hypothetical protein
MQLFLESRDYIFVMSGLFEKKSCGHLVLFIKLRGSPLVCG